MNSLIKKIFPHMYIFFAFIYIYQSNFPALKPLSIFSAIFIVLIGGFYMAKYIFNEKRKYLFPIIIVLILTYYCFEYYNTLLPDYALILLKDVTFVNLFFFPFYYFGKKGMIGDKFFNYIAIILLLLNIYNYINSFANISSEYTGGEEFGELVNNSGYYFVSLLPFLFFIKNTNTKIVYLFIISFFVLYSAKRGAIITLFLGIILMFRHFIEAVKNSKYKFFNYFIILLALGLGLFFLNKFFAENSLVTERFMSMLEGESSNRDVIYEECWNKFWDSEDVSKYVFGYGLAGSMLLIGGMAHNDWLQVLADCGIIGVSLLLMYYIGIFSFFLKEKSKLYKGILMICLYILFFRTFFTMSFTDLSSIPLIMVVGYIAGKKKRKVNLSV